MNDQDFWHIVAKANHTARYQRFRAEDQEYHLSKLAPERIVEFDNHFHKRVNQADIGDVYGAGCLLHHEYMSDDSFLYFRYWLVSMGQVAYEQALLNPDSMAMLEIVHDRDGYPRVTNESYCYAIYKAYEKVTGHEMPYEPKAPDSQESCTETINYNWMDYTYLTLEKKFPLLWNNYLSSQPDREAAYKTFSISSEGIAGEW